MSGVAVVSGAARGLGAAIARRFADDGYLVVGLDVLHPEKPLAEVLPETASPGVVDVHLDVSDRAAVLELVATVRERLGGPQVLVNNAAIIDYALVTEFTEEAVDRMLAVGVKGMLWLSQAVVPGMRADGGGAIVNVSSITSTMAVPRAVMYGAFKGAQSSMTRQLAVELAPDGIRVNAVAPGFVPTPGSLGVVDEAGVARREARTPLHLATPEDIAATVAFLASDQARATTGQNLVVDGGMTVSL